MAISITNINQVKPLMQSLDNPSDMNKANVDTATLSEMFGKLKYVSINWMQLPTELKQVYFNIGLVQGKSFSISETVVTAVSDWASNLSRMKIQTGHLLELFRIPGVGADNGIKLYNLLTGFRSLSYDFAATLYALHHLNKDGHTVHTNYQLRYEIRSLPIMKYVDTDKIMNHVIGLRDIRTVRKGLTDYLVGQEDLDTEAYFKNLPGCQIITGGGGTGKTTTIVNIVNTLSTENSVIILTPTNKAKSVLLSRLPVEFSPMVMTVDAYKFAEDYIAEILIIDECSMLTNYHFTVIRNRPAKKWTYLVGDPQQLAPVGTGSLFANLIQKRLQPTTLLKKNYRTEATDILDLAAEIVRSQSINIQPSESIEVWAKPDYEKMIMEPNSHIITHTRAVTNHINKNMNDLARYYNKPPKFKYMANDSTVWYRNRMVIRRGRTYHDADTDEPLERGENWGEHHLTPGFCTTIHTAQGGGWDTVYLVLNLEEFKAWQSIEKELLYTAVTRAKKKLVIITTWDRVKLKRYPRRTLISEGLI